MKKDQAFRTGGKPRVARDGLAARARVVLTPVALCVPPLRKTSSICITVEHTRPQALAAKLFSAAGCHLAF